MVTWTANKEHLSLFSSIADTYVQSHPDSVSEVRFETIPDPYIPGLTTQMAGGSVPDLAWVPETNALEFVSSGALTPLTDTLNQISGYEMSDLLPNALKLWQSDDKLYAYPFSNSPFGLYANLELLKKVGQPTPAEMIKAGKWTWDDVAAVAAEANRATGKGGLEVNYGAWDQFAPMWMAWGASPWTSDGSKCTLDSAEMQSFFGWLHRQMYSAGAIVKPGENLPFLGGDAFFKVAQVSTSGALDFDFDFVPLPSGPRGRAIVIGEAGITVLAKSAHQSQALDFLGYFTNPQNAAKLAAFFPPPRQKLLTEATFAKAAPKLTRKQIQTTVLDQIPKAIPKMGHPKLSQFYDIASRDLDALYQPRADVAGVLRKACSDIDPILRS